MIMCSERVLQQRQQPVCCSIRKKIFKFSAMAFLLHCKCLVGCSQKAGSVSVSVLSITAMMTVKGIRFLRKPPCALCFAHLCKRGIGFTHVQLLNRITYIKKSNTKKIFGYLVCCLIYLKLYFWCVICIFVNKGTCLSCKSQWEKKLFLLRLKILL